MSDYFPPEVIVEILHRLPLKSLVKCISVCKAWKSLITHHAFISDHLSHTLRSNRGHASLFLQLYSRKRTECPDFFIYEDILLLYSDNKQIDDGLSILTRPCPRHFFQKDYSIMVGTCYGLVCFADVYDQSNVILWNPSIQKYLVLPKPNYLRRGSLNAICGFGFDSINKDFKVVRFVTSHNEHYTPQVEVFSLASRSWRSITCKAPTFILPNYNMGVRRPPQMFVNGALHWVFKRTSSSSDDGQVQVHNFILSFDVAEETFGEVMLPQCLKESPFEVCILVGEELLVVVHKNFSHYSDENFCSIWVMKEYGVVESWFPCDLTRYWSTSSVLAIRSSGELLLKSWSNGICLLDLMKEIEKKLGLKSSYEALVGFHVESLFLINENMQFPTFDHLDDSLEDDDFDDFDDPNALPSPPHISISKVERVTCKYLKIKGEN